MIKKDKIMIFIPMYNCERQISRVVLQFIHEYQSFFDEIVIIDNRSEDNSLKEAQRALEENVRYCKATLLQNEKNYSLGGSIKIAFNYAIENSYDYMIVLHGDDQGNIKDAIPLIESKIYKNYDMCIGARFHADSKIEGYSIFRTIGNKILNFLCSMITKVKIYDLIAGLNIYRVNFLKNNFYLSFPDNLTFDVHCLLYMIRNKKKFIYFPLTWRELDQVSNAKLFKQTIVILKLFLRFIFNKGFLAENLESSVKWQTDYKYRVIYCKNSNCYGR